MEFDNETKLHWDDYGDFVFDWARKGDVAVRVQAYRKFVEDHWKMEWKKEMNVKAAFDAHKRAYLQSIERVAQEVGDQPFGVFVIQS